MKVSASHARQALICSIATGCSLFAPLAQAQQGPQTVIWPMEIPAVIRMHAGGSASGIWSAEAGLTSSSGSVVLTTASPINTLLDPGPAPQAVYQTARTGALVYTFSGLTPGATYPVNLHFAEIQATAAGQREFNVAINGKQVLANFDVFAAAGAAFMAVERAFTTAASSSGQITLQFGNGPVGSPLVSGIEILPPLATAPGLNTGVYTLASAATQLTLDSDDLTAPGSQVIQYAVRTANTNQQWQASKLPNGMFALSNLSNGLLLDGGSSGKAGAALLQTAGATLAPTLTQQWKITPTPNGHYSITNTATGFVMDSGATASNYSLVTATAASGTTSQQWTLTPVQFGAATPFVSYEAEWAKLGGNAAVVSLSTIPTNGFSSAAQEASGRAYVHLTGQASYIQWTNNTGHPVTAVNVRYSLPDAPAGGGISATLNLYVNGTLRQSLPMTSAQTWLYATIADYDAQTQTPAATGAYLFWDEVHAFVQGDPIGVGQTVALRIDTQNTAPYYDIDVIDLEAPLAPITQPANSLSITTYGAVSATPQTVTDAIATANSTAITQCIAAAEAQGASVWIPPGTFYVNSQFLPTGITVEGAGAWYSTIYMRAATNPTQSNIFVPTGGTIRNFSIDSDSTSKRPAGTSKYALNLAGNNWTVSGMWIQHTAPLWAAGSGGLIENNRVNNTWGDGININNGSGVSTKNTGNNITVRNNFVRGSGDDSFAINDQAINPGITDTSYVQMQNPTVINNTAVAPWWANDFGVYGGINILVANNFASGGTAENGIGIGPFAPIGGKFQSGHVQGNILFQAGGHGENEIHGAISVGVGGNWSYDPTQLEALDLRGNTIVNPLLPGIQVDSLSGTLLSNNSILSPTQQGIVVNAKSEGNATFINNTVADLHGNSSAYQDEATAFSATGSGNNGFTPQ